MKKLNIYVEKYLGNAAKIWSGNVSVVGLSHSLVHDRRQRHPQRSGSELHQRSKRLSILRNSLFRWYTTVLIVEAIFAFLAGVHVFATFVGRSQLCN